MTRGSQVCIRHLVQSVEERWSRVCSCDPKQDERVLPGCALERLFRTSSGDADMKHEASSTTKTWGGGGIGGWVLPRSTPENRCTAYAAQHRASEDENTKTFLGAKFQAEILPGEGGGEGGRKEGRKGGREGGRKRWPLLARTIPLQEQVVVYNWAAKEAV